MSEYDLQQAKAMAVKFLLRPNRNIVGVGMGKKMVQGAPTQQDCVRVYVVSKLCPNNVMPDSLVPLDFLGVPTDVIPVGRFGRTGRPQPREGTCSQPGSYIRVKTTAPNVNQGQRGTLGAVVTDGTRRYILSCNHVLAVNGRVPRGAEVVSAEFVGNQPTIAEAGYFVTLQRGAANSVDCAVALLSANTDVKTAFPGGFRLTPDVPAEPLTGMAVTKFGAVTGRTSGMIVDTDADLYMDYSFGTFLFEHQVMIDGGNDGGNHGVDFAAAGDSGSLVATTGTMAATSATSATPTSATPNSAAATALIFGASGRFAVACPLGMALTSLAKMCGATRLSVV
jgi:hypothetical protein